MDICWRRGFPRSLRMDCRSDAKGIGRSICLHILNWMLSRISIEYYKYLILFYSGPALKYVYRHWLRLWPFYCFSPNTLCNMSSAVLRLNNRKSTFYLSSSLRTCSIQSRSRGKRHVSNKSNTGGTANPELYCRDQVQKHDYEGYLNCFAYPSNKRSGYFALKAFNVSTIIFTYFY